MYRLPCVVVQANHSCTGAFLSHSDPVFHFPVRLAALYPPDPNTVRSPHGFMIKLEQHVKFPLQLDVTRFCYAGGDRTDHIAAPQVARASSHYQQQQQQQEQSAGRSSGVMKAGFMYSEPGWPSSSKTSTHDPRTTRSPHVRSEKNHALLGGNAEGVGMVSADGSRQRVEGLGLKGVRAAAMGGRGKEAFGSKATGPRALGGVMRREGVEYDLRAVIVHDGGADAGHYRAFRNLGSGEGTVTGSSISASASASREEGHVPGGVMEQRRHVLYRSSKSDNREGRWVSLSDETVQAVTAREVLASQAYMLFYKRIGRAPYLELG